jgi:hypothetical protein
MVAAPQGWQERDPTSLHQLHFTYPPNQKNKRLTITMAGLAHDMHYEQFHQCATLYDGKK